MFTSILFKNVIMIGPFPPPLTGMAYINRSIFNIFKKNNIKVVALNTSPINLNKNYLYYLYRLKNSVKVFYSLLFLTEKHSHLYISISTGYGQIYEIGFVLIARLRGLKIYFHHHSFSYINNKKVITSILIKIAGNKTIHITLARSMGQKLSKMYKGIDKIINLSNIALIDFPKGNYNSTNIKKIGFLSNIFLAKGIVDFIDLVDKLNKLNYPIKGLIAGPYQDSKVEQIVFKKINKLNYLKYIGPVYDYKKKLFFEEIDLLVFPTKYKTEAEPIIIYEAMSYGIPVIAYGRGCISEQIGLDEMSGKVISPLKPFLPNAIPWIEERIKSPILYQKSVMAALNNYRLLQKNAMHNLDSFIAGL